MLAAQRLLVLLGLAPLLAQLVQRLGDPGRLQPPRAEVPHVLPPPLQVRLVGAQARQRRSLDCCRGVVVVVVAPVAPLLLLLLLLLVWVRAVVPVRAIVS